MILIVTFNSSNLMMKNLLIDYKLKPGMTYQSSCILKIIINTSRMFFILKYYILKKKYKLI